MTHTEPGYITQKQADEAKARPIVLAANAARTESPAPYFVEEVRKQLEERYGAKRLYENGLAIQTALALHEQIEDARQQLRFQAETRVAHAEDGLTLLAPQ